MTWLIASIAYLVIHAALYFVVLRRTATFTSERGVFLYHLASAVLFTLAAAIAWLAAPSLQADLPMAVGTVFLHGIYSLSFLETWSLSEGGYSLQIMRAVGAAEATKQPVNVEALEQIGSGKQSNRLSGLQGLGLIRQERGTVVLTTRGRIVAAPLDVLHSLISPKASG